MSQAFLEKERRLKEARRREKRRRRLPWLLVLPSILVLLALILYPLGFSLRNAFFFWNLQTSPDPQQFIGLENFRQVFRVTSFWPSLRNTFLIAVIGTGLQFVLGMGIALLLSTRLRGLGVARALLIMPTTIAPIVTGFLFRYMYQDPGGIIPWLLNGVGLPVSEQGLLGSASTALAAVLAADTWQWTPFFAIVLYAGLLSVPEELIEAAKVDGAYGWQLFKHILLPLVKPVATIVIMLRFMQLFNIFDVVLVLTRGGPGTASRTLTYSLYEQGLLNFNIGMASALTWIIVIIINILITIYVVFAFKDWEW
jgi:multiple sugar transport system permease protein